MQNGIGEILITAFVDDLLNEKWFSKILHIRGISTLDVNTIIVQSTIKVRHNIYLSTS